MEANLYMMGHTLCPSSSPNRQLKHTEGHIMSIAHDVIAYQQNYTFEDTVLYAMKEVVFEEPANVYDDDEEFDFYTSIWIFSDASSLYLEDETFYLRWN